ncbi:MULTISPECIES: ATPase [Mumia]|uniref:ATPase n=1 Tax=Mumia TaxID=1546255 RepID=UPI001421A4D1|nr:MULTISPECIES: ATPase [unclassified Mumia]QMW67528.1 ATPase [Mumia sp. ZJ1417]
MDAHDRIDKRREIDASAQEVWDLVSIPGWYINDGTAYVEHEIEYEGDVALVRDPQHGVFAFRTVALEPPRYAAFRWIADHTAAEPDDESTLVEFWIDERPGGVTLRVAESGFASLSGSEDERRAKLAENAEGWEIELVVARDHLTVSAVTGDA